METELLRIVFIGASQFGLRCLKEVLQLPGIEVVGVVTALQKFQISYAPNGVNNVLHADVASYSQSAGLPIAVIENNMSDPGLYEMVSNWQPEAFLVVGWYHMISKRWRELAPAYGLHASLLPDYSGGAPLVWAMINGETKTGITMFQMDEGVDSGPIAGQITEPIYADDTIATLYSRIEDHGLELLRDVLPELAKGTLVLRDQDNAKRRVMPQRSPEDGLIDWGHDAATIVRFIRAQARPYPGAFTTLNGKPLHIWNAVISESGNAGYSVGKVNKLRDEKYVVSCGNAAIQLYEISYEQQTYYRKDLSQLLGEGGQVFGDSKNYFKENKPC